LPAKAKAKPHSRGIGKEACEREGSSLRRSTLIPTRSTLIFHYQSTPYNPHGRVLWRWVTIERCIGFSSTAVLSVLLCIWLLDMLQPSRPTASPRLACGISTRPLIMPRNVDGQDCLSAPCNAPGHSPNTYVALYFTHRCRRLYLSPSTASVLLLDTSLSDLGMFPDANMYSTVIAGNLDPRCYRHELECSSRTKPFESDLSRSRIGLLIR
jgi:hypothetical protein